LRHAERGDDTSKGGTLTDNGKKQSEEVGARLTKFKEDFVLGASEFVRAHQTVESIAKGRGQAYDKRDTIPQLNDDWYNKNNDAVEKAKNECGGGWEVTSKYAYTGAYSTGADAAYYNLAERSVELIEDVLVKKYTKEKFVLLSSHDKLMVPLVAYCSNLKIELKKYDGGKWINYLAGVAIIIDKAGNRRYVAVRGLKSGFAD
jgi:broad specificity phosphatase PhoE